MTCKQIFFCNSFFVLCDLFLLGYNKMDKKQKFSALGIFDSLCKVM